MTAFSHSLVIGEQQLSFSFLEVQRINSSKFYIAVNNKAKPLLAFEMKKGAYTDNWIICQPAPDWILSKETTFSNWIKDKKG